MAVAILGNSNAMAAASSVSEKLIYYLVSRHEHYYILPTHPFHLVHLVPTLSSLISYHSLNLYSLMAAVVVVVSILKGWMMERFPLTIINVLW